MWPISTRVNKPENDDASIPDQIELKMDATRSRSTLGDSKWPLAASIQQPAFHQSTTPSLPRDRPGLADDSSVLQLHFSVHAMWRVPQRHHHRVLTFT